MHWRLAPENPARLVAAGVPIAFTTEGLEDPGDFLPAIRKAIRRGLAPQDALRALTLGPAEMLGFDDEMGAIAPGKAAHLVVSRGDLLGDEKSEIVETWVGGRRYVHKDEGDFDLAGDWTATLQGKSLKWTVSGGDGKWKLETADDAVPTLRRIGLRENAVLGCDRRKRNRRRGTGLPERRDDGARQDSGNRDAAERPAASVFRSAPLAQGEPGADPVGKS